MNREKLFSVTASDCDWTPYCGSGAGGQKKNKTASAMRCVHRASGAVGECEEHREQNQNKKEAFRKMTDTVQFKNWMRIEISRQTGKLAEIHAEVEKSLKQTKIEVKDENGRWVGTTYSALTSEKIENE